MAADGKDSSSIVEEKKETEKMPDEKDAARKALAARGQRNQEKVKRILNEPTGLSSVVFEEENEGDVEDQDST